MQRLQELGFQNITKHGCGIYILVYNSKILYVGQSMDCFTRLSEHKAAMSQVRKGNKRHGDYDGRRRYMLFNEVYFLPCEAEELNVMERKCIMMLRPKFNIAVGNGYCGQDIRSVKLPVELEESILELAGKQ